MPSIVFSSKSDVSILLTLVLKTRTFFVLSLKLLNSDLTSKI